VAEALDRRFYALSLSGGTTESAFKGRYIPSGDHGKFEFRSSQFIDMYENGGVVLLDEMDACDENVLVSINTALDNGYLDLPDREDSPVARKHKDFVCLASANTYGHGANRMYCGRNQLDGATLDRFQAGLVEFDYDKDLEKLLITNGPFREAAWKIRQVVNDKQMRRLVSTRVLAKLDKQIAADIITRELAIEQIQLGWSVDEKTLVAGAL
jgi:MoxR-like ATPase